MNTREAEERLSVVLTNSAGLLPADQLADMQSLVRAGEPGVALENFCTQLEEYDVAIPEKLVHALKEIASLMEMSLPSWIERGGKR
jgi:hypothetical protein